MTRQTIYEWGGGRDAFARWLNRFYDLVEQEAPEIAAMFGGQVSIEHRERVADWWTEVMGGPASYTENHGGYEHMLARHRDLAITAEQRLQFVTLLSRAADDAELPAGPEFRAAIMGYAEWGTRLALHNSQPGAETIPHAPCLGGAGESRRRIRPVWTLDWRTARRLNELTVKLGA